MFAKKQTKGRGKPGSSWFSPEGGLYFSLILKPRKNPDELAPLTLLAAQAVISVLKDACGIAGEIKLPNDVLIKSRKVCGILTEKSKDALIIGIGINLNESSFPEELNATSLFLNCGKQFDPKTLLSALICELKKEYLKYLGIEV